MANDFSAETRCKALWRFESGALTADSKGTNTLTSAGTPAEDLVDFKEGACCVDIEYATTDYFTIADAALDAGFPLKNGDATKKLTWAAWIKQESQTPSYAFILSKWDTPNNKKSLAVTTVSNVLKIYWGYSSGTLSEEISTGISILDGEWYHVAIAVDGVAKSFKARVYRLSNSTVYTYSSTQTNALNVEDAAFRIGARDGDTTYRWDGKIDEVIVFDDILSDIEIDQVRAGAFVNPAIEVLQVLAQVEYVPPSTVRVYQLLAQVEYTTTDPAAIIAITGSGGVRVGGEGTIAFLTPEIVIGSGGVEVGGEGVIEFIGPEIPAVVGEGGVEVGGKGTIVFVSYGVVAVVGSGGVKVGGSGVIEFTSLDATTTEAVVGSGGVAVGGVGVIEFLSPSLIEVVGSGGVVVGGFRVPEATVVDFVEYAESVLIDVIGSGGVEVGGAGVIGFTEASIYAVPTPQSVAAADVVVGGDGIISFISYQILEVIGEGGVFVGGGESTPPDVFDTYVMTGVRGEPSIYSNFNFNSYAKYRGKEYGAGAAGLYLLEGDDDAGSEIQPGIRIGMANFGTDREKRIRLVRCGGATTGAEVKVSDGNGNADYADVERGRAAISRKVQARELLIEITGFESLDHLEIIPLVLHKR